MVGEAYELIPMLSGKWMAHRQAPRAAPAAIYGTAAAMLVLAFTVGDSLLRHARRPTLAAARPAAAPVGKSSDRFSSEFGAFAPQPPRPVQVVEVRRPETIPLPPPIPEDVPPPPRVRAPQVSFCGRYHLRRIEYTRAGHGYWRCR
jgi:hypothetical protein